MNLGLILVSGKTHEFQFEPATSASEIAEFVFAHWPPGRCAAASPRFRYFFVFAAPRRAAARRQFVLVLLEWEDEVVESSNILKLIYHGRFLHGNVTLLGLFSALSLVTALSLCSGIVSVSALTLPLGKTTVMHLVARENLPEPNSQGTCNVVVILCGNCCSKCSPYDEYSYVRKVADNLKKAKSRSCCCRCCTIS